MFSLVMPQVKRLDMEHFRKVQNFIKNFTRAMLQYLVLQLRRGKQSTNLNQMRKDYLQEIIL